MKKATSLNIMLIVGAFGMAVPPGTLSASNFRPHPTETKVSVLEGADLNVGASPMAYETVMEMGIDVKCAVESDDRECARLLAGSFLGLVACVGAYSKWWGIVMAGAGPASIALCSAITWYLLSRGACLAALYLVFDAIDVCRGGTVETQTDGATASLTELEEMAAEIEGMIEMLEMYGEYGPQGY